MHRVSRSPQGTWTPPGAQEGAAARGRHCSLAQQPRGSPFQAHALISTPTHLGTGSCDRNRKGPCQALRLGEQSSIFRCPSLNVVPCTAASSGTLFLPSPPDGAARSVCGQLSDGGPPLCGLARTAHCTAQIAEACCLPARLRSRAPQGGPEAEQGLPQPLPLLTEGVGLSLCLHVASSEDTSHMELGPTLMT